MSARIRRRRLAHKPLEDRVHEGACGRNRHRQSRQHTDQQDVGDTPPGHPLSENRRNQEQDRGHGPDRLAERQAKPRQEARDQDVVGREPKIG